MQIFGLWDQGLHRAPDVVKKCFDRWQALNPRSSLTVFDAAGLRDALTGYPPWIQDIPIQALSDIFRLELLARQGGVWVDATALPVVPLDEWLPQALAPAGFFAFSGRRGSRFGPIDSWFVAARPGNPACRAWLEAVQGYWDRPRALSPATLPTRKRQARLQRLARTFLDRKALVWERMYVRDPRWAIREEGRRSQVYPYFWLFLLAADLKETCPKFRDALASMPAFPHELTHALQWSAPPHAVREDGLKASLPLLLSVAPVHKLDWRRDWPEALWTANPAYPVLLPSTRTVDDSAGR